MRRPTRLRPPRWGGSSSRPGAPSRSSKTSTSRPSCAAPRAEREALGDRATAIPEALRLVHARIARAAARRGRDPATIELVAVTKGVAAERVREALAARQDLFGENRVQEAEAKIPHVGGGRWHLVGHLQSNKARRAVDLFEAVHSVDSVELANRIDRLATEAGRRLSVYLQVNVDRDPAKSGFHPAALERELTTLLALPSLEVLGLMTVGLVAADPESGRSTFRRLAELASDLRGRDQRLGGGLSMGMSDDFEVAVEEGSTCLRIGRAIFGERPAVR